MPRCCWNQCSQGIIALLEPEYSKLLFYQLHAATEENLVSFLPLSLPLSTSTPFPSLSLSVSPSLKLYSITGIFILMLYTAIPSNTFQTD